MSPLAQATMCFGFRYHEISGHLAFRHIIFSCTWNCLMCYNVIIPPFFMLTAMCWKSFHCFWSEFVDRTALWYWFIVSLGRKIDNENQRWFILLWMQQHWHQVATILKRSLPLFIISNWKYFTVSCFRLVIDSLYVFVSYRARIPIYRVYYCNIFVITDVRNHSQK